MKLWQALDKAIKELKVTFVGNSKRKYTIIIEDNPFIVINAHATDNYYTAKIWIDVRDWEKVKNSIDTLLNKEI